MLAVQQQQQQRWQLTALSYSRPPPPHSPPWRRPKVWKERSRGLKPQHSSHVTLSTHHPRMWPWVGVRVSSPNLQVSHKLLGRGEGGELGSRSHADPGHGGARAPPQPHHAVLPVDDPQSVAHSLTGGAATHELCTTPGTRPVPSLYLPGACIGVPLLWTRWTDSAGVF